MQRVVEEDFPLQLVADILPSNQVRDILAEIPLVSLVGII